MTVSDPRLSWIMQMDKSVHKTRDDVQESKKKEKIEPQENMMLCKRDTLSNEKVTITSPGNLDRILFGKAVYTFYLESFSRSL